MSIQCRMNCSWVRPALRVRSEMLLITSSPPPWMSRSPREQVEQRLVAPPGDHVERAHALGVTQARVGAVAEQHLHVTSVAVLLHHEMERGHALRVLEIHVRAMVEEPRRGFEAAPLDRAEEGRLVFRDGVEAGAGLHEQVDGLHVVVKPAVQRQYSGDEPRFRRSFARGRLRPRESVYQSGVALKAPPPSTKAGPLISKPRSRRSRASARERAEVLSLAGRPQRKWSALRRRSSLTFASSG